MTVSARTEHRGRKQKIGSVCFTDSGRLAMFIGYTPCCHAKMMVTHDEARLLIRRFGCQSRKHYNGSL